FSKGEFNEDIDEYRGYVDLLIRYGSEDDWLVSTTIRRAGENRNMVQMDVSFPVRKNIFYRSGGYIYVQLFHGYGESMITYDEKQSLQFRIGFAIVR
ncbi:MAG: phospholipase A, partial [Gammaproteobacteria bacterium]|nr:phospholipase A [Gammaproteobacteria bacterium]